MTFRIRRSLRLTALASLLTAASLSSPAQTPSPAMQPNPKLPTVFLVGDLPPAAATSLFDSAHLNLASSAASGRTTRAYINSGDWDKLLAQVKAGDFILLEFAPATLSAADRAAATRILQGIGDGTFDYLDPGTQKLELVHSYGWYLRRMVVDTINHGASPILCSPPGVAQNSALGSAEAEPTATDWTRAIATEQRIPFVDLSADGSEVTPAGLRSGLEALQPDPLAPYLKRTTP